MVIASTGMLAKSRVTPLLVATGMNGPHSSPTSRSRIPVRNPVVPGVNDRVIQLGWHVRNASVRHLADTCMPHPDGDRHAMPHPRPYAARPSSSSCPDRQLPYADSPTWALIHQFRPANPKGVQDQFVTTDLNTLLTAL
jgi:hypothetical protein